MRTPILLDPPPAPAEAALAVAGVAALAGERRAELADLRRLLRGDVGESGV